jgi:hypothetical protein
LDPDADKISDLNGQWIQIRIKARQNEKQKRKKEEISCSLEAG